MFSGVAEFACFYLICLFFLTEMDVEEFAAHSGSVNCLRIGKKACRQFITGGDDKKVNLWSIGNPTPLMVCSKFEFGIEYLCS